MTAAAVRRRLRTPEPWRFLVARLYSRIVLVSIAGAVGYGWAYAGLTKAPQAGSAWTALWLSVLGATVLMKVSLAFGPVFAGADRMFWVLSSPASRGALLRPRFFGLLAVGAAVGVVWPAVVFGVVGAVVPPLVAGVLGAACGLAVVAGAVVLQRARVRAQGWLSGLVGLAVVALVVPAGWFGVPVPWAGSVGVPADRPGELAGGVPADQPGSGGTAAGELGTFGGPAGEPGVIWAAWAVAIGLALVAAASVRHLRRSDLASGAALAGVTRVSVSWFDLALLGAILAERRARSLGRVKSARLNQGRSHVAALAWTDALRLRRTPSAALVWAALLPVPALVALGGEPDIAPAAHLVAAFLATDRLAAGLKFVCRSPAMRRALGLPDRQLRLAHLVFPAVGAVLWCAITTAFTPHVSVVNGIISAAGAVAVVYRIATRPPVDYGAAIVSFGMYGPTPAGLIVQLSRGPALLTVLGLVQTML
ncbi:DUF6297 family protein [Lentzea waywayandensis]|uniref:DUF6297 family protein n=1 Tax=Lentzea waywayandensis TaxID=84724 RepID=UPI0011608631|nr:DUF6297 family protein [Lentzea waywayandensis]